MVRIRYVCGHNLDRVNSQQSHHGSTPPTCFVRRCVELNIYSIDPGRGFAKTPSPHCYVDDKADRKSTRLNSSHVKISYAVLCLKKKINYILDFVQTIILTKA